MLGSYWVRNYFTGDRSSCREGDDPEAATPGWLSGLPVKMLSFLRDVPPAPSGLDQGNGSAGPVMLAGEASMLSLTLPSRVCVSSPPTATMSGWAKLQWTFLNPRHHLPVPQRAESDLLMERGMAKSITCFNFFIHLITLKALRMCSASLGTLQWPQRMFMAGNDHLIRTEAPSHPRCWWTLKPGDGRGCIFSDEVQCNVITKSTEKLHKDPDYIPSPCACSLMGKSRWDRAVSKLEKKSSAWIPASILASTNHVTLGKSWNILNKIVSFIKYEINKTVKWGLR